VINNFTLVLELLCHPTVAVARKLQTQRLYAVYDRDILLRSLVPVVETAPGDIHQPTPLPDRTDKVIPLADDFTFLSDWLGLFYKPFL
jgi:hypothetical protein